MNRNEVFGYIFGRQQEQKKEARGLKHDVADASNNFPDHTLATAFRYFMRAAYSKAREARDKYNFPELGWATPDWQEELQRGIAEHVQKGDPRDVAVYAMFAWFHGWSTAFPVPDEALHKYTLPATALYWHRCAIAAETKEDAFFHMREAYNHVVNHVYSLTKKNEHLRQETHRWAAATKALEAERASFQGRVAAWMQETFGPEVSADQQERGFRFGEEAIELLQANGTSKADVLKLVDYVYDRPVGELAQEVGGALVTLAALCQARGLDMMGAANAEQARVEQPAVRAKIQAKQEDKRRRMIATPLPGVTSTNQESDHE